MCQGVGVEFGEVPGLLQEVLLLPCIEKHPTQRMLTAPRALKAQRTDEGFASKQQ